MGTGSATVAEDRGVLRPKALKALGAARAVFLDCGYDAASMDAIARAAGISKATLYAHFASKEDLFEALIRHECRDLKAKLTPLDASRPAGEELLRMARELRRLFAQDEGLTIYRIIVPVAHRFPRLARIFYEEGPETAIGQMADFFRAVSSTGRLAIPDPDVAAHQFLALVSDDLKLSCSLALPYRWAWDDEAVMRSSVSMFLSFYAVDGTPG